MAELALESFNALLESIPGWIADLESLSQTSLVTLNEIISTYPTAESDQVQTAIPSDSLLPQSQDLKGAEQRCESLPVESSPLPNKMNSLSNSDALRLAQRKRKTASVLSGGHSGPVKYRSRTTAVLYYDGAMQVGLEKLVRGVGLSRNTLRKAKMGAKVDALSRTSSSSSGDSSSGEDCSPILTNFRNSGRAEPVVFSREINIVQGFDRVDKSLGQAQSLFEQAAHQLLRDGDCLLELTNAKSHLEDALKHANAELPTLRLGAERAAERRKRSEERNMRAEQTGLKDELQLPGLSPNMFQANGKMESHSLEIDDDSDGGDDDFDSIPLGNFAQIRSSRMQVATTRY